VTAQITVSIPYHGCPHTIRRAVESVLGQTITDLRCVVVNDADTGTPPWPYLTHITDPRLIRHDLPVNRGRYFADAVTLAACDTPWWMVHDADDWSEPAWLERLLDLSTDVDVVLGAQVVHHLGGAEQVEPVKQFVADGRLRHHAHMAGLWRTGWLRRVGGPHPDYRVGYDTLMTALPWLVGRVAVLGDALYHRQRRPRSLTTAPATGMRSPLRRQTVRNLHSLWTRVAAVADRGPDAVGDVIESTVRSRSAVVAAAAALTDTPPPVTTTLVSGFGLDLIGDGPLWTGWALHPGSAAELDARLAALRPNIVVESGSGSSTLLLARYAAATGATVISLEQDARHAAGTVALLTRHGLANMVDVRIAALRVTPDGPWYDTPLPDGINLALVDGPRARDGGRAAALPALWSHLAPGWEVWLDDGVRPEERAAADEWTRRYGVAVEEMRHGKHMLRISVNPVAHTPVDASDVVVTVLTGSRPVALATTLAALRHTTPGLLDTAHVYILHNGADPDTQVVLDAHRDVIDDVDSHTGSPLTIGEATSRCAAAAADSGRRWWLHLEDDWAAVTASDGWLDIARQTLTDVPEVAQVRLRHRGERTLPRHMVTRQPIRWQTSGAVLLAPDAHLTCNPTLMRTGDVAKMWPASGEREAQRRGHAAGLRTVAQHHPGVFVHIGDASLRAVTGCPT
jgi:predicted O-methyltransferase YrrM